MAIRTVTDAIRYVGADDNTLTLFENQYPVQPMGVSYNSYIILDEKIAVMDSVDARAAEEWLSNVAQVLEGRSPDYLVVTHMEPDHSGSLFLSSVPRAGHCTDSKIASASVSSSTALSSPSEEARLSRSLSTVMFFISLLTNFCMRSPDFTAHEPFSMRAKVRFCRFSAFISIRKSCMAG